MVRTALPILAALALSAALWAQDSSDRTDKPDKPGKATERNREAQESSSRDSRVDISPPKGDDKNHPDSKSVVTDLIPSDAAPTSDVQEFHPWNTMKALKDVEVGDYYFKRKNYRAALDRYKEALYWKENDAVASFRLAVCQDKLGDKTEAKKYYEQYLKILPEGPFSKDAHSSLDRLAKNQ
jgi:tetratricopeptide (TPR) repeat protein